MKPNTGLNFYDYCNTDAVSEYFKLKSGLVLTDKERAIYEKTINEWRFKPVPSIFSYSKRAINALQLDKKYR